MHQLHKFYSFTFLLKRIFERRPPLITEKVQPAHDAKHFIIGNSIMEQVVPENVTCIHELKWHMCKAKLAYNWPDIKMTYKFRIATLNLWFSVQVVV